MQRESNANKLE
jgi:hypothetical protein